MYTHNVKNCLPLRALRFISVASYIYSNIHNLTHTNLTLPKPTDRGRNAGMLRTSAVRTNYGKKLMTVLGANIYNAVPDDIKNQKHLAAFKWTLKCHLRNEDFIAKCLSNQYLKAFGKMD